MCFNQHFYYITSVVYLLAKEIPDLFSDYRRLFLLAPISKCCITGCTEVVFIFSSMRMLKWNSFKFQFLKRETNFLIIFFCYIFSVGFPSVDSVVIFLVVSGLRYLEATLLVEYNLLNQTRRFFSIIVFVRCPKSRLTLLPAAKLVKLFIIFLL